MKNLFKKYFSNFIYFYKYLGIRIFVAIILSIIVGITDGFGLSMFLPIIQVSGEEGSINPDSLGKLYILVEGMQNLGIVINLKSILFLMLFFFVLKGIFVFFANLYKIIVLQFFVKKLRTTLLDLLNSIKYKYFVTADAGRIQNTLSGEIDKVAQGYNSYFATFEQSILVIVYTIFAIFIDSQFAILVIIGAALTNVLYRIIYKYTQGASRNLTSNNNIYQGQIIQHITNYKYLKATGLLSAFSQRIKRTIELIENNRRKIGTYNTILSASREPLLMGIVVLIIIIQTTLYKGEIGNILVSLLFFYRALSSLTQMQNSWNIFMSVSGSMENMDDFQNKLISAKDTSGEQYYSRFINNIKLINVSFAFGENDILKDINLEIKKNETVAFVGESGSGKTTLINIITGLYKINGGHYNIDNISIEKININSFQKKIGYVTQEPVIFNDTIYNNVTLWDEYNDFNYKKFLNALIQASITDYVDNLDKKENSELENNGLNLSGGQRQRISIARELYKDIDILIMDEATSSLDSETEKLIQENIKKLKGYLTILIIAHRLSTVVDADKIVFMNSGNIIDIGSYEELYNRSDIFRKSADLQLINKIGND